ncbi:uncharacterized protein LOC110036480 [Phalaenopsis equestris]|uniref:uncharacterized protein LOC110036480 n=1 Tax=Phalaenopsis equestris TaxID=78828 RepID=UPI0009E38172|nr:uncharacterized protein LOC110036480 [Phalaenopsis equestris]
MASFFGGCCGRRTLVLLVLATAIPFSLIVSLERAATSTNGSLKYTSHGWLRECAKWDHPRRRFLISTFFDGGIAEIRLPDTADSSDLQERTVIADADVAGNASLGIAIDGKRDRLLVVYADIMRFRSAAVAAYGLESGERFFLTRLSRPGLPYYPRVPPLRLFSF